MTLAPNYPAAATAFGKTGFNEFADKIRGLTTTSITNSSTSVSVDAPTAAKLDAIGVTDNFVLHLSNVEQIFIASRSGQVCTFASGGRAYGSPATTQQDHATGALFELVAAAPQMRRVTAELKALLDEVGYTGAQNFLRTDLTNLPAGVALLAGTQSFTGLKTFDGGLRVNDDDTIALGNSDDFVLKYSSGETDGLDDVAVIGAIPNSPSLGRFLKIQKSGVTSAVWATSSDGGTSLSLYPHVYGQVMRFDFKQGPLGNEVRSAAGATVFTADATANTILATAHGLLAGQPVQLLTTGTLPEGLALSTIYYVLNPTTNNFQLGASYLSPLAIDITSTGTGTHSYYLPADRSSFPPGRLEMHMREDVDATKDGYAAESRNAAGDKVHVWAFYADRDIENGRKAGHTMGTLWTDAHFRPSGWLLADEDSGVYDVTVDAGLVVHGRQSGSTNGKVLVASFQGANATALAIDIDAATPALGAAPILRWRTSAASDGAWSAGMDPATKAWFLHNALSNSVPGSPTVKVGTDGVMALHGVMLGTDWVMQRTAANTATVGPDDQINFEGSAAGSTAWLTLATGDVNPRLKLTTEGKFAWGTGSAAADLFLERKSAAIFEVTASVAGSVRFGMEGAAHASLELRAAASDTQPYYLADHNGMKLGAGGSTAPSWNIALGAADRGDIASGDSLRLVLGNLHVGAINVGNNGTNVIVMSNAGTEPTTSPQDSVQFYSVDNNGAGTATLGLRTEQAVAAQTPTATHTLRVKVNGTVYGILLTNAPT